MCSCMKMMKVYYVLGALVLLGLTSRAQGIKCYECNSHTGAVNENCETGVSRTAPITCPSTTKFCEYVKIHLNVGFALLGMVYRGCAAGDNPTWMPKNVGFEDKKMGIAIISYRSCNKDLCNGDSWNNSLFNSSPDSRSLDGSLLFLLTGMISLSLAHLIYN